MLEAADLLLRNHRPLLVLRMPMHPCVCQHRKALPSDLAPAVDSPGTEASRRVRSWIPQRWRWRTRLLPGQLPFEKVHERVEPAPEVVAAADVPARESVVRCVLGAPPEIPGALLLGGDALRERRGKGGAAESGAQC